MKKDIFALVAQLNKEIDFFTKSSLHNINLTKMEVIYLLYLSNNEGINQYSIAKYYNTSRKLIGAHINSLENKGYIKKVQDGRCKNLFLSKLGRQKVEELIEKRNELNSFIPMNKADVDRVKNDLSKLINVFQNINNRDNLYRID